MYLFHFLLSYVYKDTADESLINPVDAMLSSVDSRLLLQADKDLQSTANLIPGKSSIKKN